MGLATVAFGAECLVEDSDKPLAPHFASAARSRRIGVKTKGRFVFMDPEEIVALEAVGNSVRLCHTSGSCLVREPLSTVADKLRPFGFIQIHRSVLVNSARIEELRRGATGVYLLRVSGGTQYTITRTYKNNLKVLADSWLGAEV